MNLLQLTQNRKYVVITTAAVSFGGAVLYKVCKTFHSMALSMIITFLFAALSAVVAYMQKPRKKYLVNHRSGPLSLLGILAPVILVAGAVVAVLGKDYVAAATALVDAAVLFAYVAFSMKRKTPHPVFSAVLTVSNLVHLIAGYRTWSVMPQIATYIYLLFAGIIIMFAGYYLIMFSYEEGNRRLSTFLCMFGTYCCMCACLFGGAVKCLFFFAWAIFLLGELSGLLTPNKKRRTLKRPAEEALPEEVQPVEAEYPQAPAEPIPAVSLDELLGDLGDRI